MTNFEMTEKLVEKTGVSYAEAKAALERANWDMLDAVIMLEREGKTEKKSASYSTSAEPVCELIPVAPEKSFRRKFADFLRTIRNVLVRNRLIIKDRRGSEVITVPVWLAAILTIVAFWGVIIAVIVAFVCGYRLNFSGPDLGKEQVNSTIDRAAAAAEGFVNDIRDSGDKSSK